MHKGSSAASLFLGLFLISLPVSFANSAVMSGIGVLDLGGWDFSERMSVNPFVADLCVTFVVDPPLGLRASVYRSPGGVLMLPDSTYEDLKYAPADTTLYTLDVPAYLGTVYVSRTMEGHYAKFRFLQLYAAIIIEYVYQPDGSTKLFGPIAIEGRSWGSIKSLYR